MLQLKDISFSYHKQSTISSLNLSLQPGEFLGVIGESGCGKSTLLKLIYGLHDLDSGEIFWNNFQVLGPKYNLIPGVSFMKYLAQDFDLMPFTTVAENVGAFLSNIHPEVKKCRIIELLQVVEMSEYSNIKVKLLSGGQMQRVAIARVLALEPEVLLLDEPFSHIDNFRKNILRRHLFSYLKSKKITTIIASHDTTDVLSFADKVVVLKEGKVIQEGPTKIVYSAPTNTYVAALFDDTSELIMKGEKKLFYPNQIKVVSQSALKVIVLHRYFKGSHYLIEAKLDNQRLFFNHFSELEIGQLVYLEISNSI